VLRRSSRGSIIALIFGSCSARMAWERSAAPARSPTDSWRPSECPRLYQGQRVRFLCVFSFVSGQWTVMVQRVGLNDVGQANGEIQLFVDGQSMINATGVVCRQHPQAVLRGAISRRSSGGRLPTEALRKLQKAWFADISAAILA